MLADQPGELLGVGLHRAVAVEVGVGTVAPGVLRTEVERGAAEAEAGAAGVPGAVDLHELGPVGAGWGWAWESAWASGLAWAWAPASARAWEPASGRGSRRCASWSRVLGGAVLGCSVALAPSSPSRPAGAAARAPRRRRSGSRPGRRAPAGRSSRSGCSGRPPGPCPAVVGEAAAGAAEVDRRAEGAVVDVVGVLLPVAVTVAGDRGPGLGQELHLADGAVPDLVAVQGAVVGVADRREGAGAVEPGAADLRVGRRRRSRAGRRRSGRGWTPPGRWRRAGSRRCRSPGRRSPSPSRRGGRRAGRPRGRRCCRCC